MLDVTASCSTAKRTPIPTDEMKAIQKDNSWVTMANFIVINTLGETRLIKSATIDLLGNDASGVNNIMPTNAERRIVGVVNTSEDEWYYTVEFRYPNQELRCVTYTTNQD